MRIAFLTTDRMLFNKRMKPLADLLSETHDTVVYWFLSPEDGYSVAGHKSVQCNWPEFDIGSLMDFKPQLIIVWNGHFPGMNAVFHWLKRRFPVAVMENGWYPQKEYSYLSNDLAQISAIRDVPFEKGAALQDHHQEALVEARGRYDTHLPLGIKLPRSYIFVPMQLELDTQILITSNEFKTMDSLLGFVRIESGGLPILVRNHPVQPEKVRPSYVTNMTDRCASLPLAIRARKVIGINSTVLAESMLFQRLTIALADHVAQQAISCDWGEDRASWKEAYDFRSLVLIYNQWDYKNPPGWLIDKINRLDFSPRNPVDIHC